MWPLDESQFAPYLNQSEIQALVRHLAQQIRNDYSDEELLLVCVLHGALLFTADLIRMLKLTRVQVEFVCLTSFEEGGLKNPHKTISFIKDIQSPLVQKHVLVVEEIIDSGRTLQFLLNRLQACQPASLEVVTLLDKPSKRLVPISPKYVGKKIEDTFLVGYGMDLEEKYRNLPNIFRLKYPH